MPEKSVMQELVRLKQSREQFVLRRQDQEATLEEIRGEVLTDG